jgi:hypothetical protein
MKIHHSTSPDRFRVVWRFGDHRDAWDELGRRTSVCEHMPPDSLRRNEHPNLALETRDAEYSGRILSKEGSDADSISKNVG